MHDDPRPLKPTVLALVGLGLLVYLSCWASIALTREGGRVATLWLSNGLVLGLLLSTPRAQWRAWLVAATLGNVTANLHSSDAVPLALALAMCNTVELLAAAWPLSRRFPLARHLFSPAGALWFAACALLLAPLLSALAAAAVLNAWPATRAETTVAAFSQFSIWFRADALGILIVTPLVVALRLKGFGVPRGWAASELPWTFGTLAVAAVAVFSQSQYPLLFVVFPFLLLVAARHGLLGAVVGMALVTMIAVAATLQHRGPLMLVDGSMATRLLGLQTFLAIASIQCLGVSVLMQQRENLSAALRRSEQQLRSVTDNMPALIAHMDAEQRYLLVNAHITKIFGDKPEAMLGRTMREVRGEAIYSDIRPHVEAALRGESVSFESAAAVGGRSYHYQSVYIPDKDESQAVRGFYAMTFDITARKESELKQAASEERLRTITNNMPGLIAYIDVRGRYRFCNDTHGDWFGKPAGDWIGLHYGEVLDNRFADEQRPYLERALTGERVDAELTLHGAQPTRIVNACYLPDRSSDGSVKGAYLLMTDVTRLKQTQEQLNRLARFDNLTGLANRYEFYQRLDATLARQYRQQQNLAVLFLDIDHFKQINDTYGHAAGDAVLTEVALRLSASVRASDTVARLAGDEFVAIVDNLRSPEESQFVARKIIAAMDRPLGFGDRSLRIGVSIGVAYDHNTGRCRDELLQAADGALYEAKREGRNTFRQVMVAPLGQPLAAKPLA